MPRRPRTRPKSDAARRATRTLFQVGTVTALIQLYNVMVGEQRQLTADQVAAVTTVGTLLVSFLQNLLEQEQVVPEMMKGAPVAAPSSGLTAEELVAIRGALADRPEPRIRTIQADAPPRVEPWRG